MPSSDHLQSLRCGAPLRTSGEASRRRPRAGGAPRPRSRRRGAGSATDTPRQLPVKSQCNLAQDRHDTTGTARFGPRRQAEQRSTNRGRREWPRNPRPRRQPYQLSGAMRFGHRCLGQRRWQCRSRSQPVLSDLPLVADCCCKQMGGVVGCASTPAAASARATASLAPKVQGTAGQRPSTARRSGLRPSWIRGHPGGRRCRGSRSFEGPCRPASGAGACQRQARLCPPLEPSAPRPRRMRTSMPVVSQPAPGKP
mmetsp:Transcript_144088/g.461256  ORF Transcript_144088/g.461256 Transcript_144088/m.461256 type:complete len:254 (+) Transcript_144088:2077-2838(+)